MLIDLAAGQPYVCILMVLYCLKCSCGFYVIDQGMSMLIVNCARLKCLARFYIFHLGSTCKVLVIACPISRYKVSIVHNGETAGYMLCQCIC